jgi:ribonuclease Z
MKTALQARLVNHPFGDPGLLILLRWQGRAIQFDLGRLGRTDPADLLKITHVFVSHAHMDHFMGFDHILRLFLHRDAVLHMYGPADFLARIAGRLAGYTWNLTEDYPLVIVGHEVREDGIRSAEFRAATSFAPSPATTRPFDGVLLDEPALRVETAILDHKIPCLAFALTEKSHLNVDPVALEALGARPGKWLDQLKRAIRAEEPAESTIDVPIAGEGERTERPFPIGELRERLIRESRGQKIGYVVDTLFNGPNHEKITNLVRGADLFYCEAPFLDEDEDQATKRYHLTAKQAGILGRDAGVRRLEVFHFSPRYEGQAERIYAEARAAFRGEA